MRNACFLFDVPYAPTIGISSLKVLKVLVADVLYEEHVWGREKLKLT